jgi:hypothetical protein
MLRGTIVSLGLLLLAAACGDKGDDTDDGTSETGAPLTSTTPPATDPTTSGSTGEPMTTSGGTTHATSETGHLTTTGDDTDATTTDPTGAELGCQAYCDTIAMNCTAEWTQYGSAEFCMASCMTFAVGTAADTSGNTLGCRTYHAGVAASDPSLHCVHAGPGGSGACGANCDGFCSIAMTACPDAWDDLPACTSACAMFPDTEPYDASDVGKNTLACRLYHVTAAAMLPEVHCSHIKADSPPCQD